MLVVHCMRNVAFCKRAGSRYGDAEKKFWHFGNKAA